MTTLHYFTEISLFVGMFISAVFAIIVDVPSPEQKKKIANIFDNHKSNNNELMFTIEKMKEKSL